MSNTPPPLPPLLERFRLSLPRPLALALPALLALVAASFGSTTAGWITQAAHEALNNSHPAYRWKTFTDFLAIGLIAFPFYCIWSVIYTLPVLLITWLPAWLVRRRLPLLWRWWFAPFVGAVAGYCFMAVVQHYHPSYPPETLHREMVWALYVGAAFGGLFMFSVGAYFHGCKCA